MGGFIVIVPTSILFPLRRAVYIFSRQFSLVPFPPVRGKVRIRAKCLSIAPLLLPYGRRTMVGVKERNMKILQHTLYALLHFCFFCVKAKEVYKTTL